jgi:hypothetical protein
MTRVSAFIDGNFTHQFVSTLILSLAEVEVRGYAPSMRSEIFYSVPFSGTASQSTTWPTTGGGAVICAIDGNYDQVHRTSIMHTAIGDPDPW